MAITNKNTQQPPLSASGLTGGQLIKMIPAPRVYINTTPGSKSAAVIPAVKSNGVTPASFTDLGIVAGLAAVNYSKTLKKITTGLDDALRDSYTDSKGGTIEFTLNQVDDVVMENITGLTASVITAGSAYTFHLGQEDITEMELLLVVQNKLDGKEIQFYNPAALVNFAFEEDDEAMVLKVTADLPFFNHQNDAVVEEVLAMSIFA